MQVRNFVWRRCVICRERIWFPFWRRRYAIHVTAHLMEQATALAAARWVISNSQAFAARLQEIAEAYRAVNGGENDVYSNIEKPGG